MRIGRRALLATGATALAFPPMALADPAPTRSHAVSLLETPKLPPDFAHFPYVNPDAPKGGEIALSSIGTFDNYNPFILRGNAPGGIARVWEALLVHAADEATVAYGHLARVIEIAPDRSWAAFELRPEAKFHDGTPVTAEDVVWTFDTLRTHGRPVYRQMYADVTEAVAERPDRVVFHFRAVTNRELPQIVGDLSVLPKHWFAGRDFTAPLNDPPLGSGPYRVERAEFGRTLSMARVQDWWARDMPTGRGLNNFDRIRTEYFRDATVALQAFKAGQIDFREENIAKQWATAYDFPAVRDGLVKHEAVRQYLPTGMQGFAMNTRRPVFADRRVRQAMAMAFDFEWANRTLFYGAYTRTLSYFSNSALASSGVPAGAELALLEPFREKLPPELFTTPFTLPVTDGSGNNRAQLVAAMKLCEAAGWSVRDRVMTDAAGKPVSFEFLLPASDYERVALPYAQSLQKLGIEVRVRTVDPAQYQQRMDNYDFDMTLITIPESESPGNEQIGFWTSKAAEAVGGDNICGVRDPVVDAMVARVVGASDRDGLLAATHALDRTLLWGWYMVPNWHVQVARIAYWDRFSRPDAVVRAGIILDNWWVNSARSAVVQAARGSGGPAGDKGGAADKAGAKGG